MDTYSPYPREPGETALELPGAVRSEDADIEQHAFASNSEEQDQAQVADTNASKEVHADDERDVGARELSDGEQRQVKELQQRDREVRAHEQAHAAAGARNVRYDYQVGPDGRPYAVGGSCDIEMSYASDDSDAKVAEARRMRAAALAPADPSAQDMAVAAKATRIEAEAAAEKAEALSEEQEEQDIAVETQPAQNLHVAQQYGVPEREPTGFAVIV